MCKVSDHLTGAVHEPGVKALFQVLERRMDLQALFANPSLLSPLVHASGGYPRDLLRMAREVLLRLQMDNVPLPAQDEKLRGVVGRVLDSHVDQYEQTLDDDIVALLTRISRDRNIVGVHRADLQRLADLFDSHFVLSYRNGSMWFDLHPLVRMTRRMQKALNAP
jgi:hypothetical protein